MVVVEGVGGCLPVTAGDKLIHTHTLGLGWGILRTCKQARRTDLHDPAPSSASALGEPLEYSLLFVVSDFTCPSAASGHKRLRGVSSGLVLC